MQDKIRAILQAHMRSLAVDAVRVARAVESADCLDASARAELCRILHTLKGSSAQMGFAVVSRAAERLEDRALACRTAPPTPDVHRQMRALAQDLSARITALRIEDSTLPALFGLDAAPEPAA